MYSLIETLFVPNECVVVLDLAAASGANVAIVSGALGVSGASDVPDVLPGVPVT